MQDQRYCQCKPGCNVPYGRCHCEPWCGEMAPVSPYTVRKLGYVKDEPRRYVRNHDKRGTGPKYRIDPETGCWIFTGYISKKGYGQMRPHGSKHMHPAHRVFYEEAKGPIPEGLQLDHLCRNRACVNPDHLEPVTNRENAYRGETRPGSKHKPGRKPMPKGPLTFNGAKTHCKHGHPFDAENTYVNPSGKRTCRTCQSLWHQRNKPWLKRK